MILGKHCVARGFILLALGWASCLAAIRPAQAQATLEELEKRIRQELRQGDHPPADAQSAEKPHPEPGYLGLVADDKQDRGHGVRILEVHPGGPAERAGLKPGDLVTGLAEMRLRQMSDMAAILRQVAPGGSVMFEVLRDGRKQRIEVVAGRRPTKVETPPIKQPASAVPPPPTDENKPATKPALPVPLPGAKAAPRFLGPRDNGARLEQLQRRVAELERRVAELEALLRKPGADGSKK